MDLETFANEMKTRCASAATVDFLKGNTGQKEVIIQGKKIKEVMEYFELFGIGVSNSSVIVEVIEKKKK